MSVVYTLDADDIASARLLTMGVRPRAELAIFAATVGSLLACSVSPWQFGTLPLVIGLAVALGGFRLMQISTVRAAALAAYNRNLELRRPITATWDKLGIVVTRGGAMTERMAWSELRRVHENERVIVLHSPIVSFMVPKRAFANRAALDVFRAAVRLRR